MKLAICEWVTPIKGPAIFPRLKSLGIDGIQLDDWDAAAQNHPLTQSYVQRLYKDAAAQTGISLIGVGCATVSLIMSTPTISPSR